MKKNFFKKLALVLALAMVVTTLAPMAKATAAANPALSKRYANVYDGKSYTYTIKNVKKGYTVKWAVSGNGAGYANLSKKTTKATGTTVSTKLSIDTEGAVAAKNAKVAVSATVYDAKGKRVIGQKNTVTIKVSATALAIAAAEGVDVAGLAVDTSYKFSRVITPANATSTTYWTVTDKDGAATDKATVDAKGNFKATAEGEYVIKAEAKNAKNGVVKAAATQNVVVGKALLTAKQASANKVELTFNTNMKDALKVSELTMFANDSIKSSVAVKDITFSEDGKVVTAEVFTNFKDNQSYTVVYNKVEKVFESTIGTVASIELSALQVEEGVEKEITPVFKNAQGVDISSTIATSAYGVEVEATNGYYEYNNGVLKLVVLEKGQTAKVTVTLFATEYDDFGLAKNELKKEFTVTAVEKAAITVGAVKYTLTPDAFGAVKWDKELNNKLSLSDVGYQLWVSATKSDKTTVTNTFPSDFTYESSNPKVLIVNGNTVTPVGVGSAYIIVKSADEKLSWDLPVTVAEERKAATIAIDGNKNVVTASTALTKTADFKVIVNDQLGSEMDVVSVTAKSVSIPKDATDLVMSQDGNVVKFSVNGVVAGTYKYILDVTTANGNKTIMVTVVAQTPGGTETFDLALSATEVDATITADSATDDITVEVSAVRKEGGVVAQENIAPDEVTVTKDGKTVATGAGITTVTIVDFNIDTFEKVNGAGTYKVVARLGTRTFTKYFIVKDNQTAPAIVKINKNSGVAAGNALSAVREAVMVKQYASDADVNALTIVDFAGKTTTTIDGSDTITAGTTVYVTNVTVKLPVAAGYYVLYTVPVGGTFTVA